MADPVRDLFHPATAKWFSQTFAGATEAQLRAWPVIARGQHTLVAAPTGSGKTLSAFMWAIDTLNREAVRGGLVDTTKVVYVSPLKALSNDIRKNLEEPLEGIRSCFGDMELGDPVVRAMVRTGDTPPYQRQSMAKRPPHILVTTPESLYLLLTSESGRKSLGSVETVIIDEIHALAGNRRGSHLALSLERLEALCEKPPQRIGLSATQKPIETVAEFLVGRGDSRTCEIVDEGHQRPLDLGMELPSSPVEAVMANEVWDEIYDRIAGLIEQHQTTLVFVNTRRLAERLTLHLSERLGEGNVTSHHGSLSTKMRLKAEQQLKSGEIKAMVATASLELGIDIGDIDLVCQIGSTHALSTFLQRVGRAGHQVGGLPKGRIFPTSRDDLVECVALLKGLHKHQLDALEVPEKPKDVLAQQIVAETAAKEWHQDELFETLGRAYPYRDLSKDEFEEVVHMLADGFTSKRGRRGAHIYHDAVNRKIRGRKGARITALTSGGAIPENADYRVLMEPTGLFVGTINEDFAIESLPGDVFQLGNASWEILKVEQGVVRVADAHGRPPTIPFWLGEAPSRTDELSFLVSELRTELEPIVDLPEEAVALLLEVPGVNKAAAIQIVEYLAATKRALGALPTQNTVIAERFFDEAGGMQLVLHSPFGGRINRAWGLALRKTFCRSFNFELQAAANEDAIVLSLGQQHSFPLEDVFKFLHPNKAKNTLVQALLDAPMFQTRWRWNTTRSLAIPRFRMGKKVPVPIQRMEAEDFIAAVFPDQLACLENIAGDREIPDHPLVQQTIDDCLIEAMDIDGFEQLLHRLSTGDLQGLARDVPEPSPLSHEILNARPYAFLDDAPLEERRTRAVMTRRSLEPRSAGDLGALDTAAIDRVCSEAALDASSADELHDSLLLVGVLPAAQVEQNDWQSLVDALVKEGRCTSFQAGERAYWVAAERAPMVEAAYGIDTLVPAVTVPERQMRDWTPEEAHREIVRGWMEVLGPVTEAGLSEHLLLDATVISQSLIALEGEGFVLRGAFRPTEIQLQWCNRRLLARIHNLTLHRLRAEIEPVSCAQYLRFLVQWQHLDIASRARGPEGLRAVLEQLDGYSASAGAWEGHILAGRTKGYSPAWLDQLCLAGELGWARVDRPTVTKEGRRSGGPVNNSPITLYHRDHAGFWAQRHSSDEPVLSGSARRVFDVLKLRGASFFKELLKHSGLLNMQVEEALGELVSQGLVTADSYAGLRALLVAPSRRRRDRRRQRKPIVGRVEAAGRWSIIDFDTPDHEEEELAMEQARILLRRWGVVFRKVLERETNILPWRELTRALRRMEARGEIRGGRFVAGFSGEQFALPEAVGTMRKVRRENPSGELIRISASDPLNLAGILVGETRITSIAQNWLVLRDGLPVACRESGKMRALVPDFDLSSLETSAILKRTPAVFGAIS
jgi:ATP-dependent Lhr-like helicase